MLLTGVATFTVASLVCGLAPTLPVLLMARGAQGLGAAGMMALAVAMVGDIVPTARVGQTMGLLGTMSAIGTTLGPSIGGVLMTHFGWEAIFLVNIPIGILTWVLAYIHVPADQLKSRRAAGFGGIRTPLLAFTLTAYALAVTLGSHHWTALNTTLLLLALGGGAVFILTEVRSVSPLIDVAMLRSRQVRASLATSGLVSTVMMTTLVVGPFHLSQALGLRTAVVGFALSVGPLVAAVTGVPAGRMVDRIGAWRVTIAGLIAIAVAASILGVMPRAAGVIGYLAPIAIMTAGYAMFQAANNTALMTGIAQSQRGVASGMLSLSRNLGLITGAAVMGAVFAWASGTGDVMTADPDAIAAATRLTFGVAAVVGGAAVAIAVGGGRHLAMADFRSGH